MLIAEGSAAGDVIIDKIVGEKIVVQAASLAWGEITAIAPFGRVVLWGLAPDCRLGLSWFAPSELVSIVSA